MYTIFHKESSEAINKISETISFKERLRSTFQKAWEHLNRGGGFPAPPNQYVYVVANIKYSENFHGGGDCMIELNWNISGSVNSIL